MEVKELRAIFEKHGLNINREEDVDQAVDIGPCFDDLVDYYKDMMPYGTQKARTGDPSVWLSDHINWLLMDRRD